MEFKGFDLKYNFDEFVHQRALRMVPEIDSGIPDATNILSISFDTAHVYIKYKTEMGEIKTEVTDLDETHIDYRSATVPATRVKHILYDDESRAMNGTYINPDGEEVGFTVPYPQPTSYRDNLMIKKQARQRAFNQVHMSDDIDDLTGSLDVMFTELKNSGRNNVELLRADLQLKVKIDMPRKTQLGRLQLTPDLEPSYLVDDIDRIVYLESNEDESELVRLHIIGNSSDNILNIHNIDKLVAGHTYHTSEA